MDHSSVAPAVGPEVSPGAARRQHHNEKQGSSLSRKLLLVILGLLFSAATIIYGFVWMYYIRWEPKAEIGIETKSSFLGTGSLEIIKLYAGSPAERAGIQVYDEIIAIDGNNLAAAVPDFFQDAWLHRSPGDSVVLTLRRPRQSELLHITVVFRAVAGQGQTQSIGEQVVGSYPLAFITVGIIVLFLRIEERNAWLLALLCAGIISVSQVPPSMASTSTGLRVFMFVYRAIFLGRLAFTFYLFFSFFPRRSPLDLHVPWLKWFVALLGVLITVPGIPVSHPQPWSLVARITGLKASHYATLVYIYSTLVLALVSLCWSALSTPDIETKRKFRVIMWGTLVGTTPATVAKIVSDFGGIHIPSWLNFINVGFLTLAPLSFAYAVVTHRVLEIPVLLKQSARYILGRRGFVFLLLLFAMFANVLLGACFSCIFKMQSVLATCIGGGLGIVLAWVSAPGIRRVASRIDHAFFRGAYDARIILQRLVRSIPMVGNKGELPRLIEQEIVLALHPSSVAVYLRDAQGILQPPRRTPPLPAVPASFLIANDLSQLKASIEGARNGDCTPTGTDFTRLQDEYLVSVLSRSGKWMGLIMLGTKLSEEPYSREDKKLLHSVASQAGLMLERIELAEKMAEHIDADRRVQQELQIARAVQSKMLPQHSPALATLDYAGECVQARTVGGDYYDFLDLGEGRVAFVLADIVGKGISAALLMANLQAILRSLYPTAAQDLARFLHSVNLLFVRNTEMTHYATAFFGVYDDQSRKLQYANCGHNPPILLRAGGKIERLEATATVLGLFEGWDCSVADVQLSTGDTLAIYTDGITEANNHNKEEFGEERLTSLLRSSQGVDAAELLHQILKSVQEFSSGEQADDLTTIIAICK
jgi:sigma-B regulation protein RsbU (phosphoserine phosphatase)